MFKCYTDQNALYVFICPTPNSPWATLMKFRHINQTLLLGSHWPTRWVLWWIVCWWCVLWGPGCDGTFLLITALRRRLRQKDDVSSHCVLLRPCYHQKHLDFVGCQILRVKVVFLIRPPSGCYHFHFSKWKFSFLILPFPVLRAREQVTQVSPS